MCQKEMETQDVLVRRILDAPTSIKNKLNEVMRATQSIHREVRMCAKAVGGHLNDYCTFSSGKFM
jgi:hypothetical protein